MKAMPILFAFSTPTLSPPPPPHPSHPPLSSPSPPPPRHLPPPSSCHRVVNYSLGVN